MPSTVYSPQRRISRARTGSTILAGVLLILGAAQVAASIGEPGSSQGARP
jgi:hypothetical protein